MPFGKRIYNLKLRKRIKPTDRLAFLTSCLGWLRTVTFMIGFLEIGRLN